MIDFIKRLLNRGNSGKHFIEDAERTETLRDNEDNVPVHMIVKEEVPQGQMAVTHPELDLSLSEYKEFVQKKHVNESNVPEENVPPYDPVLDLKEYSYPNSELIGEDSRSLVDQFLQNKTDEELPVIWSIDGGHLQTKDLAQLSNLLITGTQVSGKSALLHQLIISLLLTKHPSELKFVLFDPKTIELSVYCNIENHFLAKLPGEEDAVITDSRNVIHTLNALCIELDNRYDLLKKAGARNIRDYNEKFCNAKLNPQKGHQLMPFIILVVDDLAGYVSNSKQEVYLPIERLIQHGHSVGIINIISTSQFLGEVTGNLKSIIGQRAVFRLNSKEDYRRFFDTVKIEKYLKKGEFLFADDGRVQKGSTVLFAFSDIDKIVGYIAAQRGYPGAYMLPEYVDEKELEGKDFDANDKDPLFEDAARLIVQNQIGSTSLLQRRMKLGYNRAGRLLDQLEAAGVVGPNLGSKAREVLIKTDAELMEFFETFG